MAKGNNVGGIVCLIALAAVTLLLAPFCGIKLISPADVVSGADASIFWRMRVPRVLLAFSAGAAGSKVGVLTIHNSSPVL